MTDTDEEQVLNDKWKVSQNLTIAGDKKVVTIKGYNKKSVGGMLASFSNGVVTDGTWQCANVSLCTNECENSVTWKDAKTYGLNGNKTYPWGNHRTAFEEIESTANWIWVNNSLVTKVWCRKTFGKLHKMTCSRQLCVNRNTRNMSLHETFKPYSINDEVFRF